MTSPTPYNFVYANRGHCINLDWDALAKIRFNENTNEARHLLRDFIDDLVAQQIEASSVRALNAHLERIIDYNYEMGVY